MNRVPAGLMLSLAFLAACAVPKRKEQAQVRELSLHAYDEGEKFAEQGNYNLALDRFVRSAQISPRPAAQLQSGKMHEQIGEKEEAALAYLEALRLAPDYQEARFALLALGYKPPPTEELVSDPNLLENFAQTLAEEVEARRIEADLKSGELTEEEREARREKIRAKKELAAHDRIPTLAEARAVLFPAGGRPESIPSVADPAFASDRTIILNTYPFHFANGQRMQKRGEFEKAAEEYQQAISADPLQIDARLNLGDVMLRLERFPQAQFHYQTALDQFPDSAKPLLKMGNYFDSLKRPDQARDFYNKAIAKDPKYTEAYNNLAALEIREQKYDQAIVHLTQALQISPDYALAYLNLGVANENTKHKKEAIEAYRKYVELGGERAPEVRKWIAEME